MSTKEKSTILVDMDDTIVDLLGSWVGYLNKTYGLSVDLKDITEWDMNLFFPTLTKEQIFNPLLDPDFWSTVKPKKDAVKYLKMLKDEGHQIIICTSTYYAIAKDKFEKALFKYLDFITSKDIVITYNKQLLNADFLIDDGIHNLVGGKYKGILVDMPHNQDFNEQEYGIYRVKTWKEIYTLITDITNGGK